MFLPPCPYLFMFQNVVKVRKLDVDAQGDLVLLGPRSACLGLTSGLAIRSRTTGFFISAARLFGRAPQIDESSNHRKPPTNSGLRRLLGTTLPTQGPKTQWVCVSWRRIVLTPWHYTGSVDKIRLRAVETLGDEFYAGGERCAPVAKNAWFRMISPGHGKRCTAEGPERQAQAHLWVRTKKFVSPYSSR
jgi:hypothetical protein